MVQHLCAEANQAIALWLQSTLFVGRVAELASLANNRMPMNAFHTFVVTCTLGLACNANAQDTNKHTSSFNQQWLRDLVSIEVLDPKGAGQPIGTGFLVGTPAGHVGLVTAKHVVFEDEGRGPLLTNLAYRLNNEVGNSTLTSDAHATAFIGSTWVRSPTQDVACRLIVWGNAAEFTAIPIGMFLDANLVEAGAPVFLMGFPLGLRSEKYALPILRRGIVARKDTGSIIVDGFVFPGNSGGPVVYEPVIQVGANLTTTLLQGSWLVGIVVSEISYIEPAISPQTKRPRITFENNTGLCNILPSGVILELLKSAEFEKADRKK